MGILLLTLLNAVPSGRPPQTRGIGVGAPFALYEGRARAVQGRRSPTCPNVWSNVGGVPLTGC
jgi:hypothetical protein